MRHALQTWSEQGRCAAIRDKLVEMAVQLLEISQAIPRVIRSKVAIISRTGIATIPDSVRGQDQ